jgi:hypothetical protein
MKFFYFLLFVIIYLVNLGLSLLWIPPALGHFGLFNVFQENTNGIFVQKGNTYDFYIVFDDKEGGDFKISNTVVAQILLNGSSIYKDQLHDKHRFYGRSKRDGLQKIGFKICSMQVGEQGLITLNLEGEVGRPFSVGYIQDAWKANLGLVLLIIVPMLETAILIFSWLFFVKRKLLRPFT